MIVEFSGGIGAPVAERGFRDWLAANPDGYYINDRKSKAPMLHRAGCGHIDAGLIAGDSPLTYASKVCGSGRAVLEAWGRSNGAILEPCSTCKP